MSTVVIEVDDKVSLKLFMDLAKKLQLKAKVLTETQKEEIALLAMMEQRKNEEPLDIDTTFELLSKSLQPLTSSQLPFNKRQHLHSVQL